ncbi:TPA: hypothetical protein DEO28_00975 [Candidatus Dependentiae bacterium]|nr:MAG: Rubredoxin-NAD(+) reductase [candidate division TM6 bacterium GW2011_GWE2_31_21]KKP54165.1 MAG: Rubredoxin-NAD(+) reductase [candidate division TM6 bacterium GW2011_GWF2_33_332]HBS47887.1 hypothetical protein [Candidatus Dependentiae bacterium]HBZ73072.1 hypothetical protein [Candidatus Dependentiae bacterium]
MKTHIVIGSSAVGISVLSQLRKLDANSKIICITKSQFYPYNTCLLADYLTGEKTLEDITIKDEKFFTESKIEYLKNSNVTNIDTKNKFVILQNNQKIFFDTLTLGVGANNIIPSNVNIQENIGIFFFKTLEDTNHILQFIKKENCTTATVLGTGLVGMEIAESLSKLGLKVNLIGRSNQLMSKLLDNDAAEIIEKKLQNKNITFYKNETLEDVTCENNKIKKVKLQNNQTISTDLLIIASGSAPNLDLAQNSGIEICEKGIVVDQFFQTNIKDIYAAGDAIAVKDILSGNIISSCTWPDAIMQGILIANSITNKRKEYKGALISFSSKIFETYFASCGQIANTPSNFKHIVKSDGINYYRKFLLHENKLKGFLILNNNPINFGIYRKMILDQKEISESNLL